MWAFSFIVSVFVCVRGDLYCTYDDHDASRQLIALYSDLFIIYLTIAIYFVKLFHDWFFFCRLYGSICVISDCVWHAHRMHTSHTNAVHQKYRLPLFYQPQYSTAHISYYLALCHSFNWCNQSNGPTIINLLFVCARTIFRNVCARKWPQSTEYD